MRFGKEVAVAAAVAVTVAVAAAVAVAVVVVVVGRMRMRRKAQSIQEIADRKELERWKMVAKMRLSPKASLSDPLV